MTEKELKQARQDLHEEWSKTKDCHTPGECRLWLEKQLIDSRAENEKLKAEEIDFKPLDPSWDDMGDLFEISISISLEQALNRAGKT